MNRADILARQSRPANPALWAVKAYLDLLSRDDRLTYGTGLKSLYTISHGLATLNHDDIRDATHKASKNGLIPFSLNGFMTMAIMKNCHIYGSMLRDMINDRIVSIANGDVQNPPQQIRGNTVRSRREYYVPPGQFLKRVKLALRDDYGSNYRDVPNAPVKFQDVVCDAEILLTRLQGNEGNNMPTEPAWGALADIVEQLVGLLEIESAYETPVSDYRVRSRHALKILWVIAKLLMGDLTTKPARHELALVDLSKRIHMSDGTLAAIPFPIRQSIGLFEDTDPPVGVSMKGRIYLAAVAAAAFNRCRNNEEG